MGNETMMEIVHRTSSLAFQSGAESERQRARLLANGIRAQFSPSSDANRALMKLLLEMEENANKG